MIYHKTTKKKKYIQVQLMMIMMINKVLILSLLYHDNTYFLENITSV
jgi:hypothetical protein